MVNQHGTSIPKSDRNPNADPAENESIVRPDLLQALQWRSIGPYRGGRVVAVAGDPQDSQVFYFGSTGGGVWKTTDGGVLWENVSDGYFERASVGAIAVAASDPNIIYVGMGETTIRGNVSHGDGVYKSTDRGQTWTPMGLIDTRHIGKICIHPENPDLVYIAALGHAHGPNSERGVYRSQDGGKTWENILFRSERAGAVDLSMDPNNPRILYATFWETVRLPHTLISGGEGSGLFKSTDGGDTWTEITRNPGLPEGLLGKIGIAVSPAKMNRVWAVVEAEDGAVFRSDDGGGTWERLSEERQLRARPWYYQHIIADPQDAETVWVLNVQAWKSIDGGLTFFEVPIPHGDNHALWIDPHNPSRMIEGNDGGACISFTGGTSWSTLYNQPTAEFYHVTTDNQVPYRVYGAQQDNSTISVPSRSSLAGITQVDTYDIGGGESGYIAVSPADPNIVYAGNYQGYLTRYDHRTRQMRNIAVWPELASGWGANAQKYRFQWTYPILLSPFDPNTLYVTGNHVFRSTDEGGSWEVISPDLTRNDITKMEASGGPITRDNTGAEYYGTIFAFAESKIKRGLFWAGSDDGLIHISRDNGESWQNVTPKDLPEWALISIIEPSPHDPATAYVAATRYKLDDYSPYLFKTSDYGKTWTKITTGIAPNEFTRVIREDPVNQGLLYAGTETGLYVSFDDGQHWQSLRLNLPVVPVHDLEVKDTDLVAATHGRSFWILDDITPLREIHNAITSPAQTRRARLIAATADVSAPNHSPENSPAYLFKPRTTIEFMTDWGYARAPISGNFYRGTGTTMVTARREKKINGETIDRNLNAGQNPPDGVMVYYSFKEKPEGEVKLSFLTAQGEEIRTFSSEPRRETPDTEETPDAKAEEKDEERKEKRVFKEAGLNLFIWNMRYPDPSKVHGYVASEAAMAGPLVAPGTYQVQLIVGDTTYTQSFEISKDPRVAATQQDLEGQFELRYKIWQKLSETHDSINTLRNIRQQLDDWVQRTQERKDHEAIAKAAKSIKEKLADIEEELIQFRAKSRQDTLNFPAKLNAKLAALAGVVGSAQSAPTRQEYELFDDLVQRIDVQLSRLQQVIDTDVASFNNLIRESDVPAVIPIATLPEKR